MTVDIQPRAATDLEIAVDEVREARPLLVHAYLGRFLKSIDRLAMLPESAEEFEPPDPPATPASADTQCRGPAGT